MHLKGQAFPLRSEALPLQGRKRSINIFCAYRRIGLGKRLVIGVGDYKVLKGGDPGMY